MSLFNSLFIYQVSKMIIFSINPFILYYLVDNCPQEEKSTTMNNHIKRNLSNYSNQNPPIQEESVCKHAGYQLSQDIERPVDFMCYGKRKTYDLKYPSQLGNNHPIDQYSQFHATYTDDQQKRPLFQYSYEISNTDSNIAQGQSPNPITVNPALTSNSEDLYNISYEHSTNMLPYNLKRCDTAERSNILNKKMKLCLENQPCVFESRFESDLVQQREKGKGESVLTPETHISAGNIGNSLGDLLQSKSRVNWKKYSSNIDKDMGIEKKEQKESNIEHHVIDQIKESSYLKKNYSLSAIHHQTNEKNDNKKDLPVNTRTESGSRTQVTTRRYSDELFSSDITSEMYSFSIEGNPLICSLITGETRVVFYNPRMLFIKNVLSVLDAQSLKESPYCCPYFTVFNLVFNANNFCNIEIVFNNIPYFLSFPILYNQQGYVIQSYSGQVENNSFYRKIKLVIKGYMSPTTPIIEILPPLRLNIESKFFAVSYTERIKRWCFGSFIILGSNFSNERLNNDGQPSDDNTSKAKKKIVKIRNFLPYLHITRNNVIHHMTLNFNSSIDIINRLERLEEHIRTMDSWDVFASGLKTGIQNIILFYKDFVFDGDRLLKLNGEKDFEKCLFAAYDKVYVNLKKLVNSIIDSYNTYLRTRTDEHFDYFL
ncbi:hypothetical protein CDIK_1380 [Cucumispora dikerogammari]|nr:hypothetical protein CDIK_1380 [Cucumispora dikerogammari]